MRIVKIFATINDGKQHVKVALLNNTTETIRHVVIPLEKVDEDHWPIKAAHFLDYCGTLMVAAFRKPHNRKRAYQEAEDASD